MRRDRVAVLGRRGIFEDSLVAALASNGSLRVRQFPLAYQGATPGEIRAFGPDVVVVVGKDWPALPDAVLPLKEGVAIITLDPREPNMSFSYLDSRAPATLDSVLEVVRTARAVLRTKRTSESIPRGKGR